MRVRKTCTAAGHAPVCTAVVYPVDQMSLCGALEAAPAGLIAPILIGPEQGVVVAARTAGLDLGGLQILPAASIEAAAAKAVEIVLAGDAEIVMKGALHTDALMHTVISGESNLRTERRLSHVFVMAVPRCPRPLLITDAAINIAPDLEAKRGIVQNAIGLAHALGMPVPRVAILSAVETVSPTIKSTLDAAALCKMAEHGQITGAILDGPLAFDNAISISAAKTKGIVSAVAGAAA